MSKGDTAAAKAKEVVEVVKAKVTDIAKNLHKDLDQNEALRVSRNFSSNDLMRADGVYRASQLVG